MGTLDFYMEKNIKAFEIIKQITADTGQFYVFRSSFETSNIENK